MVMMGNYMAMYHNGILIDGCVHLEVYEQIIKSRYKFIEG